MRQARAIAARLAAGGIVEPLPPRVESADTQPQHHRMKPMSTQPNPHSHAVAARVRSGWRSGIRAIGVRGISPSRGGMFAAGIVVLK